MNQWLHYKQEKMAEVGIDSRARMFQRLLEGLDVKSILEPGCGSGHNLMALSRTGKYLLVGLDISGLNLIQFSGIDRVKGDCLQMPFPDNSFDLVLACGLFDCFPDESVPRLAREASRVSKKYLLIIDYASWKHSPTSSWPARDYSTYLQEMSPGFVYIGHRENVPEVAQTMAAWLFERKEIEPNSAN